MMLQRWILLLLVCLASSCAGERTAQSYEALQYPGAEVATFGAGCFWCSEAAFEQIDGVVDVRSGFMGGAELADPTADELIAAGHAEVVQVWFDPNRVSYAKLLEWFWIVHDPTSIDRQGEDEGPEYRSVLFVRGAEQRRVATTSREEIADSHANPIQTVIEEAGRFYPASEKHQDYYAKNRESNYCQTVIAPHLEGAGLER